MYIVFRHWHEMPFIKKSWLKLNIFFLLWHNDTWHNICGEHVRLI